MDSAVPLAHAKKIFGTLPEWDKGEIWRVMPWVRSILMLCKPKFMSVETRARNLPAPNEATPVGLVAMSRSTP